MFGDSFKSRAVAALLLAATSIQTVSGQANYKIDTAENIKKAAADLAASVIKRYEDGQKVPGVEPGILPGPPTENKGPYYWWQAGAMWAAFIDYWHLTGDTKYNELVTKSIIRQCGEDKDFEPFAHRASLGNDDQAFWGMTVLTAIERNFPDSPNSTDPGWLALAQAVFTRQSMPERHDKKWCGGGMRWQVPVTNLGYDYKNTIANGAYFNMGARLTRYTGNETYAERAEEIYDWLKDTVKYIDPENWKVYDGGHTGEKRKADEPIHNCTDVNKQQFSYNVAILAQGAATMWNHTMAKNPNSPKVAKWREATEKLVESCLNDFFSKGAAYEIACEEGRTCSVDMFTFKGFIHRWLPVVTQLAPFTRDTLLPALRKSAEKAIATCKGGSTGKDCGFYWVDGLYVDPATHSPLPTNGTPEQLNTMSAVMSLMHDVAAVPGPVTASNGGESRGDPKAGLRHTPMTRYKDITGADRAGAGILTTLVIGSALGTFGWMNWD
ncbi:hypothetical protein PpBr36_05472 [Pyricularia pennisetigena]|uniref:hypothetical protein n=1 Tax=Pyricularia pennisetigena TaxID=1578925 RepID=UPI0011535B99|nr:hypothetical protein PpBr36_05472 [Pyricularia pennisetigena]TLS26611.1 hypothetical protein PpBr36_05472 [Pyricularia pennisetigena]